jgi:hypothetical protein
VTGVQKSRSLQGLDDADAGDELLDVLVVDLPSDLGRDAEEQQRFTRRREAAGVLCESGVRPLGGGEATRVVHGDEQRLVLLGDGGEVELDPHC